LHYSATRSIMLSTMLSRLLSTLVMKGKESGSLPREFPSLCSKHSNQQAASSRGPRSAQSMCPSQPVPPPLRHPVLNAARIGVGQLWNRGWLSVAGGGRGRPGSPRRRFRERLGVRVTRGLQGARWCLGPWKEASATLWREGAAKGGDHRRLSSTMFHRGGNRLFGGA